MLTVLNVKPLQPPSMAMEEKFHLFTELPVELRLRVWYFSLPSPRLVLLRRIPSPIGFRSSTRFPNCLCVCKESAAVVHQYYKLSFGTKLSPPSTLFDFDQDTLLLDMYSLQYYVPGITPRNLFYSRQPHGLDTEITSGDLSRVRRLALGLEIPLPDEGAQEVFLGPEYWPAFIAYALDLLRLFPKVKDLTFYMHSESLLLSESCDQSDLFFTDLVSFPENKTFWQHSWSDLAANERFKTRTTTGARNLEIDFMSKVESEQQAYRYASTDIDGFVQSEFPKISLKTLIDTETANEMLQVESKVVALLEKRYKNIARKTGDEFGLPKGYIWVETSEGARIRQKPSG
jgi:hypothetical protein